VPTSAATWWLRDWRWIVINHMTTQRVGTRTHVARIPESCLLLGRVRTSARCWWSVDDTGSDHEFSSRVPVCLALIEGVRSVGLGQQTPDVPLLSIIINNAPLKALHCALVRSAVREYAVVVRDHPTASSRNRIERVQRKCSSFAATALRIRHRPHDYEPVLKTLGLSIVSGIRVFLQTECS